MQLPDSDLAPQAGKGSIPFPAPTTEADNRFMGMADGFHSLSLFFQNAANVFFERGKCTKNLLNLCRACLNNAEENLNRLYAFFFSFFYLRHDIEQKSVSLRLSIFIIKTTAL